MEFQLEEISDCENKMLVTYTPEEVRQTFTEIVKQVAKKAEIPGFRKEKAPLALIENKYQEAIREEVSQALFKKFYNEVFTNGKEKEPLEITKITAETPPQKDHSFSFTTEYEIVPKITLRQLKGLKLPKPPVVPEISEEDVTARIEKLRQETETLAPVTSRSTLQEGDIAYVNLESFSLKEPLSDEANREELHLYSEPHYQQKNFSCRLQRDNAREWPLGEKLLGLTLNETREFLHTFSPEYPEENLANQTLKLSCTLYEIKTSILPELNDEFAQEHGAANLEELRTQLHQSLTSERANYLQNTRENNLFMALRQENPVKIPKSLVYRNMPESISKFVNSILQQQHKYDPKYIEGVFNFYREAFNHQQIMAHSYFLLNAIQEQEQFTATPADIDEQLEEIFAERLRLSKGQVQGMDMQEFKANPDNRQEATRRAINRQIIAWLLKEAVEVDEPAPTEPSPPAENVETP